jgi:zinc/manganese transport system substrate-binding protein
MRMILICLSAAWVAGAAGCGSGDAGGRVEVVATTAIAADLARRVAGRDADVTPLLPGGASPHDYGASAKERARLEQADLVVAWGAGLEAGLPLDGLDGAPVELAAGERDPHIWMNPVRTAAAARTLAGALARVDPENEDAYRRRADACARRLAALDRELQRTLAAVPPQRRKLVTSHDSLGHFGRRYGFELVGAPFGLAPGSEPSAKTVARLIERVESEGVPAVFADATDDPAILRQVARATGAEVVDDLLVEGFGGEVESYEAMLRHDARLIAAALAR